jgi:hypothetical protein
MRITIMAIITLGLLGATVSSGVNSAQAQALSASDHSTGDGGPYQGGRYDDQVRYRLDRADY